MEIDVIIKIPQGSRNKYEMDAGSGRIRLDRTLHLDPLPRRSRPAPRRESPTRWSSSSLSFRPPGRRLAAGVFWNLDERGPDAKILTVPARDPRYADLRDLPDVPRSRRRLDGRRGVPAA